jgi:5-methylcytosine-specific restriction endonuclease McrA
MKMTVMTKKARIEQAREVIDRNDYGIPFNADDLSMFSYLTGCTLRYACRRIDPNYPTNERHVEVLAYDWEEPRGWSWRKAIEIGQHDVDRYERYNANQAMRDAVRPQIVKFLDGAEKACAACASTDSLTVDHVWPPFLQISADYVAQFGLPQLEENTGSGFKFANQDDEKRWQDCHQEKANLGILCRSCNSKKGARPA